MRSAGIDWAALKSLLLSRWVSSAGRPSIGCIAASGSASPAGRSMLPADGLSAVVVLVDLKRA